MKCEVCHKRESVDDVLEECDFCLMNYWDRKCYRCHSPEFISNWWVRQAYKLHVPYPIIQKVYGGLRFI